MENTLDQILELIHKVKDDEDKLLQIKDYCQEIIGDETREEHLKIPDEYEKLVPSIAETVDSGQIVYINTDTMQFEEVSQDMEDPDDYEFNYGDCDWAEKPKSYEWDNKLRVASMDSHESYRVMEDFTANVLDDRVRNELINALQASKPFAHFKQIVDGSPYRQDWFTYKQMRTEKYVREFIILALGRS